MPTTHRMRSLGRLFMLAALVTGGAAWNGCVADARGAEAPDTPADETPAIAASQGALLASVPFDGEGSVDFVELEPGTVVAQGSWNADEASPIGDAVRQVTVGATVLQAYELLSGARASGDVRTRLVEADKRIEVARAMRVDALDNPPPVAEELVEPATGDLLVDKALSGDAQWFYERWCIPPQGRDIIHTRYVCRADQRHCGYQSSQRRDLASHHIIYVFNQLPVGYPQMEGYLYSSSSISGPYNHLQTIEVPARTVNWTYRWTGFKYRYASTGSGVSTPSCAHYTFSEYWLVR